MIAAGYLIFVGGLRLSAMFFAVVYTATKTSNMSAGLLVSYALSIAGAAMVLFAGAALFLRKSWSRKFALGALAVVGYFLIKRGALLLVSGHPAFAFGGIGPLLLLTTLMFVLLLRRSAVEVLP
jgi:K+ transporter